MRYRTPLLWRALLVAARAVVVPICRLRVTGDVPDQRPLILAANHLSPFDPVVLTAACRTRRIAPRIMATGGLFRAPVVGAVMRRAGHIRVDRRTATVAHAMDAAVAAVAEGSIVATFPEGRIGLDPGLWPERGKTGTARLALASGAPVLPVAIWGAHEVVPYDAPRGLARALGWAVLRRPVVRVHFAGPVDLSGLSAGRPGDARRATERILDAVTVALATLRPDEPGIPRYVDPTRPVDPARSRPRVRHNDRMIDDEMPQMPTPDPALRRLDGLVGTWRAAGSTVEGPLGPATPVTGTETFEWMEGGFFLVHRWESSFEVAGTKVVDAGYEFLDYDPETGQYRTHFFNSLGPYDDAGSHYAGGFEGDALVVTGPARISRRLNGDGTVTVDSDIPLGDDQWAPMMVYTLTKTG